MTKLSLFQRLFTREVVGEITEKGYTTRGFGDSVTIYTVKEENGALYRAAILGHQENPEIGDRVEMFLKRGDSLVYRTEELPVKKANGRIDIVLKRTKWEQVRSYKIM